MAKGHKQNTHGNDEVHILMRDPIIKVLVAELKLFAPMHDKVKQYDLNNIPWNFIINASRVYNERGGTNAVTIGGPAKAIVKLVQS